MSQLQIPYQPFFHKSGNGPSYTSIPDYKVDLKQPGSTEFVADRAGTFPIVCSVVCGVGHAKMAGKLIVD